MHLSIFNSDGFLFLLRWAHFLGGITWIGLLYYFNFVQGAFFKEIDAGVKNVATQKLVPRALWWFRWGAMLTFVSGVLLITGTLHTGVPWQSSWGIWIIVGGALGTLMWFNVWFVIWPNQKVVIASAEAVLKGAPADPKAGECASRALVTSRTNVLFSIPMLFFMGAARHLALNRDFAAINYPILFGTIGALLLIFEVNALKGKLGPLETVKGVIHSGFVFAIILYLLVEVTTR